MSRRKVLLTSGETFYEPADWVAFMRDAVRGYGLPSLGLDARYDYAPAERLVPMLYHELAGSDLGQAMSDASMVLMESGDASELRDARCSPFEHARDARARLFHLLTDDRRDIHPDVRYAISEALLRISPEADDAASEVFADYTRSRDNDLLNLVARYSPRWFLQKFPAYSPTLTPYVWVLHMHGQDRADLLSAIAGGGDAYVQLAIAPAFGPRTTEVALREAIARLSGHPTFERAIAERLAQKK